MLPRHPISSMELRLALVAGAASNQHWRSVPGLIFFCDGRCFTHVDGYR